MASCSTTVRNLFDRCGTGNNRPRAVPADGVGSNEKTVDDSFVELPDNRKNIASTDGFDAETSTNSYCPQPASSTEEYSKPNDSLDLLYDPQSCASSTPSSSAVDVIAVHGLNGSATKTWMHPNGKLWLKDFLPTALPDARIFTYGYDAKVRSDSASLIRDHATKLLVLIDSNRTDKEKQERPIIFVAHSLGGLVVKKAIVIAKAENLRYRKIWESVHACMFFGTPHRGSTKANLAFTVVSIVRLDVLHLRPKLLALLSKDSDTLNEIAHAFASPADSLDIVTCYEQRPMKPGGMIVPKESAILGVPREDLISMERDHRQLCRFQNDEESDYVSVREKLINMAKHAIDNTSTAEHDFLTRDPPHAFSTETIKFKEYLDSLWVMTCPQSRPVLPEHTAGTCEWIFEEEPLRQWCAGEPPSLLWMTGAVGCGKTMLSSFLAEELSKRSAPIRARITRPINVLLCFCEGYGSDRTSATEIVGSLLYQLLSQRPTELGKQFVRQMEHGDRSKLKDFDTLWRIFAATIKNSGAGSTFIIIDGIDLSQDCSASDNYVHRLSGLLSSASQSSGQRRIQAIFTSQRCARIAQEFMNSSTIHLDSPASLEMIQKDLRLVTHQQVQDVVAENRCQDEEEFLVSSLLAKAKSLQEPSQCPLWVTLVTKQLMISPFSSKQTLRQFIDDLPPSLNGLYLHSLNKVSEQFRQEAIYLVSIVLGARRPLTLDELTVAWSMNRVRCTKAPIKETREPYIRRTIRSLLGSMVQCVDEKVQIVHDSIRGFLRESKPNGLPSSPFLIQDKAANLELAHNCVGYLLLDDCDVLSEPVSSSEASTLPLTLQQTQQSPASPTLDQGNMKETKKPNEAKEQNARSPDEFFEPGFFEPPRLASTSRGRFFDYSALNWISHVSLAGDELATDKNLLESIARLCEKSSPFISNWLPYYHEKLQSWVVLPENFDSLAVAAYFGLEQVVIFILREDDTITQRKKSAALHAALHPASAPARIKMIQLLLEYGAPPDDRDGLNSTPLARAAKAGYDEIVAMLLGTKKVNVNALSTGGRTALSRAVEENHLKVCKLLLDRNDIELDKFEMHGWTPFMAAAENGNLDILRALLHKYNGHLNHQYIPQSKSNKRDEIGRTAISFAAEKGHLGIVQHLLNLGPERVDADFKDNDGRSPLQYAARNGHLEVIQALVDSGRVDISSQDKEHFTAVIQASKHHHTAILEYFIERYPDGFKAHDVGGTNVLGFAFIDKSPRQLATIKLLVDSKLVDLNEKDTGGEKPMFKAATHNYAEGARYLMENGADVNAIDKDGKTPLHAVAGETFDYEMVKALVNHGANVNATDKENETPLHKVARYTPPQPLAGKPPPHPVTSGNPPNSTPSREVPSSEADKDTNKITKKTTRRNPDRSSTLEIVEFLIQHAANVNAINRQGMTPLHLAAGDGRSFEIVKFLLDSAKADPNIKNKDGEDPLMYAKAKGQSLGSSAIIAAIEQKQEALKKRQQKSKKGKKS